GLLGAGFDNMIDDLKLLISQVQKSGLQVSTSITEIAATSKQQQATANEIAATTTEISATSKEISATSRELGKTMAEVSALADQTAVATYDIELMVKEIQSAVSAGVMGMDKFSEEVRRGMQEMHQVGNQLSQIIKDVQALVPRFETVNDGMQAQAVGAGQIS